MNINNNDKAYFALPGFVEHFELYKLLNNFLKKYPEAQIINTEIYCYYGNIPFCTWDGGRPWQINYPLSIEQMSEIQNFYNNELSTKLRFVFTNNLLSERDCYNRYNNLSLQIFNLPQNEIVINSPILEKYLKENFPNYSLISSITKCISNSNDIQNELQNNYKFLCLNYNLNHNWDFLNTIQKSDRQKIEFLVNSLCLPNCQNQKNHFEQISNFQRTYGQLFTLEKCQITETSICPFINTSAITIDEIFADYVPNGFQHFKIDGRSLSSYEVALSIANYLIKPEYRHLFLRNIFVILYKEQFNFDKLKQF